MEKGHCYANSSPFISLEDLDAPAADTHTLKVPHPGMVPWWGRIVLRLRKRAQEKFVHISCTSDGWHRALSDLRVLFYA